MIIGLSGVKQSGKDTSFKLIEQGFATNTRHVLRRGFADALKVSVARSFGLMDESVEQCIEFCDKLKTTGEINVVWDEISEVTGLPFPQGQHITGRKFLQWYGTEAHRDVFGDNFWVDHALPLFDGLGLTEGSVFGTLMPHDLVFFTDTRFPNEAERIRENGGEVWEIHRPDVITGDEHASETPLPRELVDVTIINDGTLEDLRELLYAEVARVLGWHQ